MNKKLNWAPVTTSLPGNSNETEFPFRKTEENLVKNAVYTQCYETEEDGSRKLGSQTYFDIKFLKDSEKVLDSKYFPYHGLDKKSNSGHQIKYNKPFALIQISSKDGAITNAWERLAAEAEKTDYSKFACYFLAGNLNRPEFVDKWEDDKNVKAWSQDLEKLNNGYVSFHLKYSKGSFQRSSGKNEPLSSPDNLTVGEEADSKVKAEAEPEVEPEAEPEAEPKAENESQPEPESEDKESEE